MRFSFSEELPGGFENYMRAFFTYLRTDWTSNDCVGVQKLCLIDIFCATVDVEQWVPLSIFSMGRVQVALAACVLYLLYAILFE